MADKLKKELLQHASADDKLDALIELVTTLNSKVDIGDGAIIEIKDSLSKITAAFPDGDFSGHKAYHESVIQWMRLRNDIFRECLMAGAKIGSGAVVLFILWACLKSAVAYLTSHPNIEGPMP